MKQYLTAHMRYPAFVLAALMAAFALAAPLPLQGQSTNEKVRLMADALRARDSGNLELAKTKAEELIKVAPADENVQRLLASINRELDSRVGGAAAPAVYGQSADTPIEAAMEADLPVSARSTQTEDAGVLGDAGSEQTARIQAAQMDLDKARELAKLEEFDAANKLLSSAKDGLPFNTATASTMEAIEKAQMDMILAQARSVAKSGDPKRAESMVEQYQAAVGESRRATALARELDQQISDPYNLDINEVSSEYIQQTKRIRDLLARGRAQYLNGDYDAAQATFQEVEARDANNAEAKLFQTRIATILGDIHAQNHYKTRRQMMTEVDQGWERPKVFDITSDTGRNTVDEGLQEKLNSIIIPQVNFAGMELTQVIETLSELSTVYDPTGEGVNIIPIFNPNETNPRVNITLRNLNLDRVLQFCTQQVNFSYDVGSDAVTVQPSDSLDGVGGGTTTTDFLPITRGTVIKLTGARSGGGRSSEPVNPFSAPVASGGGSGDGDTEALQSFFQSAGVNFDLPGTSLAFDGDQLIVTQTRRNLERMRAILRNYNDIKQVEIEAKFLEVAQNDLDEVGFDWTVSDQGKRVFTAGGRSIADGFSVDASTSNITISRPESVIFDDFGSVVSTIDALDTAVPVSPPSLPETIDLGADVVTNLFSATGWGINGYDVDFAIRALSRKSGSDLMSAPKITVMSQAEATITIAQELRYPENYDEIDSQVGSSNGNNNNNNSNNAGSSISITAGTPQDFTTRNIGVELYVKPTVQNDDSISLILRPSVTEFEGFVEYGGPSIALSGDTTVTVPAGFYQPVFSTRKLETEVTVFDGATLVMGGLTRDEVKTVSDKVPVLGDIPGLGRLFRSEGETRQKRNLLIFVTANLVSPGGSPARQNYRNVNANSLFQNPTIMTPSGASNRSIESTAGE